LNDHQRFADETRAAWREQLGLPPAALKSPVYSLLKLIFCTNERAATEGDRLEDLWDCTTALKDPMNLRAGDDYKHGSDHRQPTEFGTQWMRDLVTETVAELSPDAQARYERVKARQRAAQDR
jgi:hypothetical protein